MRKPLLLASVALCASSAGANAVGWQTKMSCASDYYAYCSKFTVGTPEVRKCMRANGPRLSKACINALIADGEISKAEVEQQKAKIAAAKGKLKPAEAQDKLKPAEPGKAKLAEAPKAKSEPTAAATAAAKIAAAPQSPKAKIARAPEPQIVTMPTPVRKTLSLDEKTFAAFKDRGPRFVENEDADRPSAPEPPRQFAVGRQPAVAQAPKQVGAEPAQPPTAGKENLADARHEPPAKAIGYPTGRMSLGRNLPSAQNDEPSWWDVLLRTLTGGEK